MTHRHRWMSWTGWLAVTVACLVLLWWLDVREPVPAPLNGPGGFSDARVSTPLPTAAPVSLGDNVSMVLTGPVTTRPASDGRLTASGYVRVTMHGVAAKVLRCQFFVADSTGRSWQSAVDDCLNDSAEGLLKDGQPHSLLATATVAPDVAPPLTIRVNIRTINR